MVLKYPFTITFRNHLRAINAARISHLTDAKQLVEKEPGYAGFSDNRPAGG